MKPVLFVGQKMTISGPTLAKLKIGDGPLILARKKLGESLVVSSSLPKEDVPENAPMT